MVESAKVTCDVAGRQSLGDALFATVADLGLVAHATGRIVTTNPALQQRLGYQPGQLAGMLVRELHDDGARGACDAAVAAAAKGNIVRQETTLQTLGGTGVPVDARYMAVDSEDGPRLLMVCQDLAGARAVESVTAVLRDLGLALSATSNLREAAELVVDAAMRVAQMDCGGLYLVEPDAGLRLVFARGLSEAFVRSVSVLGPDTPQARGVQMGLRSRREYGGTNSFITHELQLASAEGLKEVLSIPLHSKGDTIGCLNLSSHAATVMTPPQRRALDSIASHFGNALGRIRAEDALSKTGSYFRALVENASDMIALFDREGRVLYISPASRLTLAMAPSELLGKSAFDFIHPDDSLRFMEAFRELVRGGPEEVVPRVRVRAKDGSYRVLDGHWKNLLEEPSVQGVVVNAKDVTQLVQQSEAYARERDLVRGLLETSPLPITFASLDGTITDCNAAAWQEYGWASREEYIGRNVFEFVAPEDRERALENTQNTLTHGVIRSIEYTLLDSKGERFPGEVSAAVLRDNDQKPVGFVGMSQNVQHRKQLEEGLRHAQKMESVGRLAGGVAHDFNNLLTVIKGFSTLALSSRDLTQPVRRDLEGIREATERAEKLVKQLMVFSRRQILQPKPVCLGQLLLDLAPMLGSLLGEHVELELRPTLSGGIIEADPHQIENMIVNLAANARDAMPSGGKLVIETDTGPDRESDSDASFARLSVVDSGTGMPDSVMSHAFEPFFTTKPAGKGTGLGLATVYAIVEQHGGRIRMASHLGVGSRFDVYFPVVDATPAPIAALRPTGAPRGQETVLVVEDELSVRAIMVRALTELGYRVLEAASGTDALALADQVPGGIHLLVTDVIMPQMGGEDLAVALRRKQPETPVLFISGYASESLVEADGLPPRTQFLGKPFTPGQLARRVREVLDVCRTNAPPEIGDRESATSGAAATVVQ